MKNYAEHFNTKRTKQTEAIPGAGQVQMRSGGYGWEVSDMVLLDRFLITGTEGGTYYVDEKRMTIKAGENILKLLAQDGVAVVNRIVEISTAGRAPKNDAALFALALAASAEDEATRKAAFAALPKVARIGTHLFQFAESVTAFRNWGRGLRLAISKWYSEKEDEQLAYQLIKYKSRGNWSNRDLIRLSHVKPDSRSKVAMYRWAVGKDFEADALPDIMRLHDRMHAADVKLEDVLAMLRENPQYPWEGIPTEHLADKRVWELLLPDMPLGAMIRNLGKMTAKGVLVPMSDNVDIAVAKLLDADQVKRQRIHPINTLFAMDTYGKGHGDKGKLTWTPVQQIVDALDETFYLGFGAVEPTNKRWMISVDVSGSMDWDSSKIKGTNITARVAAAALSMMMVRTEPKHLITAFSDGIESVPVSAKMRMDTVVRTFQNMRVGGTDASLPVRYAMEHNIPIDAFAVYTDNESYLGPSHVTQYLSAYRKQMGIDAKLISLAMTADKYTVADPRDPLQIDLVGMDASTPQLMAAFVAFGE